MLADSSNLFVSDLFSTFTLDEDSGRRKKTVLSKFKSSLDGLMALVNRADVHYMRCIKPNPQGRAGVFDRQYVLSQLQAAGIIETVNISRLGYSHR